jgi:hypothetical protein
MFFKRSADGSSAFRKPFGTRGQAIRASAGLGTLCGNLFMCHGVMEISPLAQKIVPQIPTFIG